MKFKVKHQWWIWALGILWHMFAVRFFQVGMYPFVLGTVLLDIFLFLPEASHISYEIKYRQLTVRRVIYPNISFPCDRIVEVKKPVLLRAVAPGGGVIQKSLGAVSITYIHQKREYIMPVVIVSAKKRKEFLNELSFYVNATVKKEIRDLIKDINRNGDEVVV